MIGGRRSARLAGKAGKSRDLPTTPDQTPSLRIIKVAVCFWHKQPTRHCYRDGQRCAPYWSFQASAVIPNSSRSFRSWRLSPLEPFAPLRSIDSLCQ